MASDSSSGFRPGASHISLRPHKTQPRGWRKRTNEQIQAWVSSKRKKGEVYVTLLCSSPYINRLTRACILRETSTKPLEMLTHLWLSSLAASFCRPCPSPDSYLKPNVLFCLPFSTDSVFSGTFLPSSTSGLAGDLALRPFVWVSRQNRQRDSRTGAHTNGNECYILCHTISISHDFINYNCCE